MVPPSLVRGFHPRFSASFPGVLSGQKNPYLTRRVNVSRHRLVRDQFLLAAWLSFSRCLARC